MSSTFKWCKDKTKLDIWDKQVFCVNCYGHKYWFLNGKCHRENGPAVEHPNGDKFWYVNGSCHRANGPAIEYADGYKSWRLNGRYYPESTYWKKLKRIKK